MSWKKQVNSIVLLLGLASCGMVSAFTEFRSPLSLYRGPAYWPLPAQDDGKWVIESWDAVYRRSADEAYVPKNQCACPLTTSSASCCNKTLATLWDYSTKSFSDGPCCKKGSSTRNTEQLSTLFFGKSLFRVEEAFANGMLDTAQMQAAKAPAVSFSRLAPQIAYSESGFVAGLHAHRKLGSSRNWRIGARASMPFKVISTENDYSASGESLDDVMSMSLGVSDECPPNDGVGLPTPVQTYAYRLDFLSSLLLSSGAMCGGVDKPFVTYGDGKSVYDNAGQFLCCPKDGPTKMAQIDIGPYYSAKNNGDVVYPPSTGVNGLTDLADNPVPKPPVFATVSMDGCVPQQPFGKYIPVGTSTDVLLADGTSYKTYDYDTLQFDGPAAAIEDGKTYQFHSLENYMDGLGIDRDAQSKLWIVPAIDKNSETVTLEENAHQIHQVAQWILNSMGDSSKQSPEAFLSSKCVYMQDRRVAGVGDLDTEMYLGYHGDGEGPWHSDLILGVRYPTGRRLRKPGELLFMPTGNNGHFEVKGAVEGGWNPNKWLAVRGMLSGTHVCSRTEKRAVPFKGATIRNIGPVMDVDVSYSYFLGNLDFTFFHPEHKSLGCSVGYELWARGEDKLSCCRTPCGPVACDDCGVQATTIKGGNATDLLGFVKPTDCSIYKCGTASMTHKLRGEIFHRSASGYVELFGGGSYVIGGRYSMKESEFHIGVAVNF